MSDVETLAYQFSQERQAQGLPPDPEADWLQAEAQMQQQNLMNGTDDPQVGAVAYPPSYPGSKPNTWPPPSGGAPITTPEMGPITNPYPYGSGQTANINTAPPSPPVGYPPPFGPRPGTSYPQKMPNGANGQNQGPGFGLPATTKPWEVGPIAADPLISQIKPPPIMGPGPQGSQPYEVGPIAGSPFANPTMPAGHYIDGLGTTVTPTRVVGGLGN